MSLWLGDDAADFECGPLLSARVDFVLIESISRAIAREGDSVTLAMLRSTGFPLFAGMTLENGQARHRFQFTAIRSSHVLHQN